MPYPLTTYYQFFLFLLVLPQESTTNYLDSYAMEQSITFHFNEGDSVNKSLWFTNSQDNRVIIKDSTSYKNHITKNPNGRLIDLSTIANIKVDLRYASENNFLHKKLYTENAKPYLSKKAFAALQKVATTCAKDGFGIWVWDAYRPFQTTKLIWEEVQDERYAASPTEGSGHNRGLSIDLTLYDLNSQKPLLMPTDFDDFSENAHQGNAKCLPEAARNRDYLKNLMERNGFKALQTEWWHFSMPGSKDSFPLMDLSFALLENLSLRN